MQTYKKNATLERGDSIAKTLSSNYTKNFPPYGKRLDQLRRNGSTPIKRVIVSTDWKFGRAYPRIVIPENTKPGRLIFSFLAGLSVQIVHHDGEPSLVRELIEEILEIRPKILTVFNHDLAKNNFSGNSAFTLIYSEKLGA